ncbi:MAG: type II secretion system protein [Dehalococcoidales bacterium]|nr:type II secretion system protein [Dehalococcoidales bacterium]
MKNQKGMTLIELLIGISISATIIGGLGASIYAIINITGKGNAEMAALYDIQNASFWIRKDARMAGEISLTVDVASETVTLTGDSYVSQYYLSGTELLRDYNGDVTRVAWDISEVSFQVDNQSMLFYFLKSSPPARLEVNREITGVVYMEELTFD